MSKRQAETERPQSEVRRLLEGELPEAIDKAEINVPAMPAENQA